MNRKEVIETEVVGSQHSLHTAAGFIYSVFVSLHPIITVESKYQMVPVGR